MNLLYPIYFSSGLTEKVECLIVSPVEVVVFAVFQANHYYKLFISWTNQNIKNTFVQRNMFDFKHIKVFIYCHHPEPAGYRLSSLQPFDRSYIDNPGPMVVFATPGMLHAGLSLQIFKKWAEDDNNMVR